MEINDELFKKIVLKAFSLGVNWAQIYISWFEPSREDTEEKEKEAIKKCKRLLTSRSTRPAKSAG